MILPQVVQEKFQNELAEMPSWKDLTGSQFVKHLAVFIAWAIEDASFKAERARHEAFIDTALNRSSILAHGEGMEFMPRKPVPATGKVKITNQGDYPFTLLRESEFMADSQVIFTLTETVVVEPGNSVFAAMAQRCKESIDFVVTETKPFYEILIGRDISPNVVEFKVYVAEDGENFVEWTYDRLLTNSYPDSLVFDEFYHFTDQIGIRFGNGDFGKIIPAGAKIRVDVILTEGDFVLLERQPLWPVEEIRDSTGKPASAQIVVSQTVQNGRNQEGTEEMRRDLHYAPVYNERLVWDNDYKYFLRRRYPEIVFAVAWGEEESEKMWGYKLEHINKIWICAYSPRREIKEAAMSAIAEIPFMCRNFKWYDPEHVEFTVHVNGKVLKDCIIPEVIEAIEKKLNIYYGQDSIQRRDIVRLHEIYEAIYATGYFDKESGAWFEVEMRGKFKADFIYQMISINLEESSFKIEYVEE